MKSTRLSVVSRINVFCETSPTKHLGKSFSELFPEKNVRKKCISCGNGAFYFCADCSHLIVQTILIELIRNMCFENCVCGLKKKKQNANVFKKKLLQYNFTTFQH